MKKNLLILCFMVVLSSSIVYATVNLNDIDSDISYVKIGENQDHKIDLLNSDNHWFGTNIFENWVIINYTSFNATGKVTASDFCYVNGDCVSNQISYLTNLITEINDDYYNKSYIDENVSNFFHNTTDGADEWIMGYVGDLI